MIKLKLYDSAYPGSMSERPDGGFVEFNDVDSLAAALVKNYDDMRRRVEDWTDTAIQNEKRAQIAEQQRDELLAALKASESALRSYQYGNSATELAEEIANKARAAIAKAEGGAA